MGSLRFSFPMEMLMPIRKAIFGFLSDLKTYVKDGVVNLVEKAKARIYGDSSVQEVDATNKEGSQPGGPSPNVNDKIANL